MARVSFLVLGGSTDKNPGAEASKIGPFFYRRRRSLCEFFTESPSGKRPAREYWGRQKTCEVRECAPPGLLFALGDTGSSASIRPGKEGNNEIDPQLQPVFRSGGVGVCPL